MAVEKKSHLSEFLRHRKTDSGERRTVTAHFTDAEFSKLVKAAAAAGLTPAGLAQRCTLDTILTGKKVGDAQAPADHDREFELENEIARLRSRITNLVTNAEGLERQLTDARAAATALRSEKEALTEKVAALEVEALAVPAPQPVAPAADIDFHPGVYQQLADAHQAISGLKSSLQGARGIIRNLARDVEHLTAELRDANADALKEARDHRETSRAYNLQSVDVQQLTALLAARTEDAARARAELAEAAAPMVWPVPAQTPNQEPPPPRKVVVVEARKLGKTLRQRIRGYSLAGNSPEQIAKLMELSIEVVRSALNEGV